MKVNLLDFDLEGLVAFCGQLGEKPFRAKQVFRWVHQNGVSDPNQMTDLAKAFRAKLASMAEVVAPNVKSQHLSADGTIKWLFDVGNGEAVEAVFIPEADRATLGGPGKYTFCFAEDESDAGWQPLSVSRGFAPGVSTVTLFQGEGVQTKHLTDGLQPPGIRDAVDVDPQDRAWLPKSSDLMRRFQIAFQKIGGGISNCRDTNTGVRFGAEFRRIGTVNVAVLSPEDLLANFRVGFATAHPK